MEISLTLHKFPVDRLGALAAFLAGSTAVIAVTTPPPGSATDDDDEAGDTAAAVPGQLDANGIPWDARIHSTPPALTKKNVWRAKRGVTPAEVTTVTAELRARAPVSPAAPPQPQQPAPQIFPPNAGYPPIPPNVNYNPPIPATAVEPQPTAPAYTPPPAQPQQPPPPSPIGDTMDIGTFMGKIQVLLQMRNANGQALVDADYLATVTARTSQAFGISANAIPDLASRPDAVAWAAKLMASEGRWF